MDICGVPIYIIEFRLCKLRSPCYLCMCSESFIFCEIGL